MFFRFAVVSLLVTFSQGIAMASTKSETYEQRLNLGDQFQESLLKIRVHYAYSMFSFRTIYCTRWSEMKKMIDVEATGKDSIDVYNESDSCDMQCLTFWPEKIRMQFTLHTGEKFLAVQALQTDLMSTIYVFLRPREGIQKPRPYVQINTMGSPASSALAPPGTCN